LLSVAFGVGQKPEALASVGGANVGRGQQTPLRIEPEAGKVGEDVRKPSGSHNVGDVLQEDVAGSNVSDDPRCHRPEVSVIVKATALACPTEGLAGEAGSDEIHTSTPR
jgi:hypothetical protein